MTFIYAYDLLPLLMHALHTSSLQRVFLGSSIHAVAQVVGASYTMGDEVGKLLYSLNLYAS